MKKRIKSFLITASSILATAFIAVTVTPEWANFIHFANDKLESFGVPVVVITLLGVFLSEVWKQILNNRALSKQNYTGGYRSELDLY